MMQQRPQGIGDPVALTIGVTTVSRLKKLARRPLKPKSSGCTSTCANGRFSNSMELFCASTCCVFSAMRLKHGLCKSPCQNPVWYARLVPGVLLVFPVVVNYVYKLLFWCLFFVRQASDHMKFAAAIDDRVLTHYEFERNYPRYPRLDKIRLTDEEKDMWVDLSPYAGKAWVVFCDRRVPSGLTNSSCASNCAIRVTQVSRSLFRQYARLGEEGRDVFFASPAQLGSTLADVYCLLLHTI